MTSPVEALRSAAVLLRRLATEATPGPWRHTGQGPGYEHMGCGEVYTLGDGVEGGAIAAPAGDCYPRGGYSPADDMAYIATMDPLVGLALADALDAEATLVENCSCDDHKPLVALARLILGEPLPVPDGFRPVETVHLPVLGGESTW